MIFRLMQVHNHVSSPNQVRLIKFANYELIELRNPQGFFIFRV